MTNFFIQHCHFSTLENTFHLGENTFHLSTLSTSTLENLGCIPALLESLGIKQNREGENTNRKIDTIIETSNLAAR